MSELNSEASEFNSDQALEFTNIKLADMIVLE